MTQVMVDVLIELSEVLEPILAENVVDVERHFGAKVVRPKYVAFETKAHHGINLCDFVPVICVEQNGPTDFRSPQQEVLVNVMRKDAVDYQLPVPILRIGEVGLREAVDAQTLDLHTHAHELCAFLAAANDDKASHLAVDDSREKIKLTEAVHTDARMRAFSDQTFIV